MVNGGIMNLPWVEKYRPKSLDELICDEETLSKFKEYVSNKQIEQHIILTGSAGLGKTSTAKILANEVSPEQTLYICASGKGIDEIRNNVTRFCSSFSFSGLKTVILDEFDGLSGPSMMLLRNVLEEFVETTRFILTCNYVSKILDPILSRCMIFEYKGMDEKDIARRCLEILKNENVEPRNKKHIGKLVRKYYPDIRATINNLEKFTHGGVFELDDKSSGNDIVKELIDTIKNHDWIGIRQNIVGKAEFPELFKIIFDNADIISGKKAAFIRMHILEGIRNHSLVVDQEINFMGTVDCIIQEIEE